jgi:hypothetical protein
MSLLMPPQMSHLLSPHHDNASMRSLQGPSEGRHLRSSTLQRMERLGSSGPCRLDDSDRDSKLPAVTPPSNLKKPPPYSEPSGPAPAIKTTTRSFDRSTSMRCLGRHPSNQALLMERLGSSGPCRLDDDDDSDWKLSGALPRNLKKAPPNSESYDSFSPTTTRSSRMNLSGSHSFNSGSPPGRQTGPPRLKEKSRSMPAGTARPPVAPGSNISLDEYRQNRRKPPPSPRSASPAPSSSLPRMTNNGSGTGNMKTPPPGSLSSSSSSSSLSRLQQQARSSSPFSSPMRTKDSHNNHHHHHNDFDFANDYGSIDSRSRNSSCSRNVRSPVPEEAPWMGPSTSTSTTFNQEEYLRARTARRQASGGTGAGRPPKSKSLPAASNSPPPRTTAQRDEFRDDHREFREIPLYDRHGQPISPGPHHLPVDAFGSPPALKSSRPSPLCGDNPIVPHDLYRDTNHQHHHIQPNGSGFLSPPPSRLSPHRESPHREEWTQPQRIPFYAEDDYSNDNGLARDILSTPDLRGSDHHPTRSRPHIVSPSVLMNAPFVSPTPLPKEDAPYPYQSRGRHSTGGSLGMTSPSTRLAPLPVLQQVSPDGQSPFLSTSHANPSNSRSTDVPPAPMIEIEHGVFEPLRGSKDTMRAVELGEISSVECMGCLGRFHCMSAARYVICPSCRVISPVPGGVRGVGLGFGLQDASSMGSNNNNNSNSHQGVSKVGYSGGSHNNSSNNKTNTNNGRRPSPSRPYDKCHSMHRPPPVVYDSLYYGGSNTSEYYHDDQQPPQPMAEQQQQRLTSHPRRGRLDTA